MACDILFCLRSVQVWQGTVHINALADCGIPLQFQLVFPQFGLTDQYNSHRTHGIKSVVEQKTEFFQCFLFKQMSFIKDADDLFVLHSPDDLDLLLAAGVWNHHGKTGIPVPAGPAALYKTTVVSALSQTDTGQCNPLWEVPSKNGGSGLFSQAPGSAVTTANI